MVTVHPQYITDSAGEKLVVLQINEFDSIMDDLDEMEDIRLYDEAKKNDTGERIPMEDAFKMIEAKRKKME
jgi:hypothetical protein